MLKKLLPILMPLLFLPTVVFAVSVPWNRPAVGTINPLYPVDGIGVYASSTIGNTAQNGGLTVLGGATTTGSAYFIGNVGIGTTSASANLGVQGNALISGTSTAGNLVATSTLTLPAISNCNTTNALTTNASGLVSCGAISGGASGAAPFIWANTFATIAAATSSPIWAQSGVFASSTSQIASTTFSVNGNVGVGTFTPGANLDVQSNGSMPFRVLNQTGISLLEVESTGNTGVGTTSAWAKLSINNSTNDAARQPLFSVASSTANSTTTAFLITNSGNIGINNPAPTQMVHLLTLSSTTQFLMQNSSTSVSIGNVTNFRSQASPILKLAGTIFNSSSGGNTVMSGGLQMRGATGNANPTVSKLAFLVGTDDAEPTEQMSITNSGLFTVLGGADFAGPSLSNTYNVNIRNTTQGTSGNPQNSNKLVFEGSFFNSVNGGIANQSYIQLLNSKTNANPTINRLGFFTAAGQNGGVPYEQLSISTNGQVGVGSTSPAAKFSINNSTNDIQLGQPLLWIASSTATATTTVFLVDNVGHQFATTTIPTLSSCGTSPSMVGSDDHGTVTTGATASGCTVTFGNPWPKAPSCTVTAQTGSIANTFSYAVSATAITVTETGIGGSLFDFICRGNQ